MMISLILAAVFSANFENYAKDEALSDKGAQGGAWTAAALASGVKSDGAGGMTLMTDGVEFVASPGTTDTLSRVEFRINAQALGEGTPDGVDAIAGIVPAILDDGTPGFYGWGDGVWHALTGVAPTANEWIDYVVDTRRNGGMMFVRYSVKGEGGDYVTLKAKNGRTWFRAGYDANGVSAVSFSGEGAFGNFGADEEKTNELAVATWTGGDSGKWSKAKNWEGGVAPASGGLARIDGTVTLKDDSDNAAKVTDFVGYVKDDGTVEMLGGRYCPDVAIDDITRPRAGKTMTASAVDILGLKAGYDYIWYQGDYAKNYSTMASSTASVTPTAADYESWFKLLAHDAAGVAAQQELYFSKLPVCYLTTDDGTAPTQGKEEHDGTIRVQGNDDYEQQFDGAMSIKVRGNATVTYPKKPYKIKLDKKTNMFGLSKTGAKNKHWVLLANYNDPCQFRNKFAYDLANEIGGLGMESTWVNCILNGEFQGCYQFCEHIRIAEDRVNVYDWEGAADSVAEKFAAIIAAGEGYDEEQQDELCGELETKFEQDLSWVTSDSVAYTSPTGAVYTAKPSKIWKKFTNDITGGYVFEFSDELDAVSQFTTPAGKLDMPTMLNSPEYLKSNSEMFQWCQDFLSNYWNAVVSSDRTWGGKHYREYSDVGSMVNFFLVNEMFSNIDAMKKSRYASINQQGKLVWGPVWDFDYGSKSLLMPGQGPKGWECSMPRSGKDEERAIKYSMFKEWGSDWYFCKKLFSQYWKIRDRYWDIMKDGGKIDQGVAYLKEAYAANDAKWQRERTGEEDASILKEFLQARIVWLDEQMKDTHTLIQSIYDTAHEIQTSPWDGKDVTYPVMYIIR